MKYIKILILFFILFASSTLPALAQYVVKGVVQDRETLEPLSGATISVTKSNTFTLSDSKGQYVLNATINFDSIDIKLIGYKAQTIYAGDKSQNYTISLQLDNTVNTVEVTALKPGQPVTTLTGAELNRSSGLSLQDAINNVPGVNMQSRTPWGGQHIIIRGYYPSADNGRTDGENFNGLGYQLFINNIPVTDAIGNTVMDDIDFSTLGRVDIFKGPNPLYGSYVAGAVNLYTQKPVPNQTSINEQVIAGSYGLIRSNTSLEASDGKTDIWINYGHQSYGGFRDHDSSKKDFATFAADFHSGSKNTVSTYFSYNHSVEQLPGEIDSADFYARKPKIDSNYVLNNSRVDIASFRAGVTDKYQFNNHFGNQTTLFVTGYNLLQYFAHGFNLNNDINTGGRTAFTYEGGSDALAISGVLGAAFERSNQNAQGNFIPPFVQPPFHQTTAPNSPSDAQNTAMASSAFTQWTFSLPTRLSLTVGASMNFNQFTTQNLLYKGATASTIYLDNPVLTRTFTPTINPDICLTKVFNNHVSVYASISEGYAPPTISQMTNTAGKVDSALNPERAMQCEIGTRGSLGPDNRFNYQLALYDLDINNRLIQETANGISSYVNAGEQRNLGAELSLSYNIIDNKTGFITLLRPWITYAYTNAVYVDFKNHIKSSKGGDTVNADYSGKKVAAVAPNVFNIGIDAVTKPGFYLSLTYNYTDKAPVTFDNYHYMSAFSLLNAKIGFKKQLGNHFSLDVFAGANNLLGSTYYSFIFVGQNIAELGQGTDSYIKGGGGDGYILPAPYGATFYGGAALKYKF